MEVFRLFEDQPIGIFDSGVGGLTVVRVMLDKLPREKIIYIGDIAHMPYGSRTVEELQTYADQIVAFLVHKGVKLVIAACNTSSAVSLGYLKKKYKVPIIGVIEPGVQRAIEVTRNGRIGVIATEATIKSGAFPAVAQQINLEIKVFGKACPLLVPLIEAGEIQGPNIERICREYLSPLIQARVDVLILGCTHYPFLVPVIQKIMGDEVILIDPALETVAEARSMLAKLGQLNQTRNGCINHYFFSTGSVNSFLTVGRQMIGDLVEKVEVINLEGKIK